MKNITATYNKTTTVIESEVEIVNGEIKERGGRVFSFKTKKSFFEWASVQEAMNVMVTQNIKGFVKSMESLGFTVETNKEGCFDWEVKTYCFK